MDLFNYVALLLQTQQSVGIEGLGTFYNKYTPGIFDATQKIFSPPKIQTAFANKIFETEALKNLLSEKKNMSQEEVNEWITDCVKKIYSDLNEFGESNLYPLGTLQKKGNTLVLAQLEGDHKANHAYFGLPTIDTEDNVFDFLIEKTSPATKIEEEISLAQHIDEPSISLAQTEETHHNKHIETGVKKEIVTDGKEIPPTQNQPSKGWWKWFIISIIITLFSLIIYILSNKPEWVEKWLPTTENLKTTSPPLLENAESADSILKEAGNMWADSNLIDSINKDSSALKLKNQANKFIEMPPAIVDTFQVIVASYPNRTAAVHQLKLLIKNGLPAEIAYGAKGVRTKIAIGTFTNLDSAEQQQKLLQKKGFKEAWILIKKAN